MGSMVNLFLGTELGGRPRVALRRFYRAPRRVQGAEKLSQFGKSFPLFNLRSPLWMPLHIYISQFTFRIGPRKIQDGIVPAQFNREVSIHALPNRNSPSEFAEEVHNLVLSPIPVVATVLAILHSGARFRGLAYEGAVPAVDCLDESNVRVRRNLLTRLGSDANEGIVCRV